VGRKAAPALITRLISIRREVVMGNRYLPAGLEKNPGLPAHQTAVCGEDLIYVSIARAAQ
jgi:hypothetical protein